MRRSRAIQRHDRPFIGQLLRRWTAGVYHRLDRDREAGYELFASFRLAVVRYLRLLMELCADAVSHEIAHDAELGALDDALHRGSDVTDVIARSRLSDPRGQRLL